MELNISESREADDFQMNNSINGSLAHLLVPAWDKFKWHGGELIFLFLMLFLAIIGNILVIYVYHFRWSRSNFSLFIKLLASLDLINGSITIPIFIVLSLDEYHEQFDQLCQAGSFVAIMTAIASGVILVVIAVDRNRKICQPLESEIDARTVRRCCLFAVGFGALLAVFSIFVYGRKKLRFEDDGLRVDIAQCYFTDNVIGTPKFWLFLVTLGLTFTGVMSTLAFLYISMYRALKVHLARRESLGSRRPSTTSLKSSKFRSHRTSAKIFFFVTVAFFSSYFPFFIAVTVFLVDGEHVLSPKWKAVVDIAKLSPLMSNAINPFIYSASSHRFRKEILDIFRCKVLRRTPSERARVKVHIKTHTSTSID